MERLWFAWKIVLLQYRKQHYSQQDFGAGGCDLLEKSYFCSIANNVVWRLSKRQRVVICLKNRTFAVSQTTDAGALSAGFTLWFAWKIVLLQYRKQRGQRTGNHRQCCDLLEKSYFCSIANNACCHLGQLRRVVICLKNRTFAVSQTTCPPNGRQHRGLWFAWKIVLLQYRKQRPWDT